MSGPLNGPKDEHIWDLYFLIRLLRKPEAQVWDAADDARLVAHITKKHEVCCGDRVYRKSDWVSDGRIDQLYDEMNRPWLFEKPRPRRKEKPQCAVETITPPGRRAEVPV